ncbi:MAG: UDP-N-acetylmuramoyl-tripeptide--D-alanyl-D-alanine ligase [Candidatus Omnitrophota bacterium]
MFTIKEIIEATDSRCTDANLNCRVSGVSIDSRTIKPGELFIAIRGTNCDGHNFLNEATRKGAACLLVEENFNYKDINIPVIKAIDSTKALINLAAFHRRRFSSPIIAVTGSNGKTTTKELIAHCLGSKFKVLKNHANQNNQFGLALNIFKLASGYDISVLEIGTNNPGEIKHLSAILKPNIGVITNIGPSHLEGLKNIHGVFKEKISLLNNLIYPGLGLLNSDDKLLNKINSGKAKNIISFGYKNPADFKINSLEFIKDKIYFKIGKQKFILNTIASHNVYNALAAISVSRIFGISYKELLDSLKGFNWLDGRFKKHAVGNITLIDDSYNANPLSFNSAVDSIESYNKKSPPKARSRHFVGEKKILVMADMLELGNLSEKYHLELAKKIQKSSISIFICLGKYSKKIAEFLKKSSKIKVYTLQTIQDVISVLDDILDKEPTTILVKGSHAFKLENVILHLLSIT